MKFKLLLLTTSVLFSMVRKLFELSEYLSTLTVRSFLFPLYVFHCLSRWCCGLSALRLFRFRESQKEEAGLDRQLLRRYPFASHVIAVEWSSQQHLSDKRSLLIIIRHSLITRWNESHHSPWLESRWLFRRKVLVVKYHLFFSVRNARNTGIVCKRRGL